MFPYILLRVFKITPVSHEPSIRNKLHWSQVFNEQSTRRLFHCWTKWISLDGSSTVDISPLASLLSISTCWGSVYVTQILAEKNLESSFLPLLFRYGCSTLQLWNLVAHKRFRNFYLSLMGIYHIFWSQEKACPFCSCRNKLCGISSEGSSLEQICSFSLMLTISHVQQGASATQI